MNFQEFKSRFEHVKVVEYQNPRESSPSVSVCVQTYNHERYISHCLDNILKQQANFDFEILIHEDDSTDETRQICQKYAERFPEKIRLFLNSRKNNISVAGEPTGNFTTLYNLFSAKGKYIAICEGDDFWGDPKKLQVQYDFMQSHPLYSLCFHDFKLVDSEGNLIQSDKASPLKYDLNSKELLYPVRHPSTLTIFFRNNFRNLPQEITRVITMDAFFYILLGKSGSGKYLPNIKPAFYRIHDGGLWSERELDEKIIAKINTFYEIINYYSRINDRDAIPFFRRKIFKSNRYLLYLSIKNFQPAKCLKYSSELIKSGLRLI